MRKGCTLIVKKMWSKYSQWRSFSESKPVPCTNSLKKCPYWLVVWPICRNFMLCFLLVPLLIASQYSTGPHHNMRCKYMLDVLGWTPLSQRRQEARLILFYKIINGLAQVPFEDTGLLSLKLRHWVYSDQIFLRISVHPFRIIP